MTHPSSPETGSAELQTSSLRQRAMRLFLSDYFVLYLSLAYFFALVPFLPTLSNPANLANVLSNMWPLLVVAIGQTFVLTIAGIDLSQGSVVGFTSVVAAMLLATTASPDVLSNAPIWGIILTEEGGPLGHTSFGIPLAILIMILVGAAIGAFNGFAIAQFQMPPFMVTLVTMIVISAFAIFLTQSENIRNLPEQYILLGKGDIVSIYLGAQDESRIPRREIYSLITYPMVIAISVAIVAHLLLNRTVFGKQVFAVGTNRKAAEISGVPVRRIIVLVFTISAVCATIGAILYSTRLEAGRPTLGEGNFLLDVIGATVIGGTSLFGGKGKIIWTVFGVFFFVLLSNTLNLMNLSSFHIDMVKGSVIVAAALLDVWRTRLMREMNA
ncbi:ABC transporter permease [uncultured Roseobacter sp.]|uniref:ABC transporter permease n=1 Tax=uncultured Roseobacter sp. TaxID=114847 RepID=UPI0026150B7F|nr:ABC transporter permease [uncultured Roseobacter sp.]